VLSSRSWFRAGRLGPSIAIPRTWEDWTTFFGIALPAAVFAGQGGEPMVLLSVGLFAFLFGLAYAMADEAQEPLEPEESTAVDPDPALAV
jgi:hypothetical protein